MSQALYRKYRSRTLDEILGQDHVTRILKSALKKKKIAHAYLLAGPRGTGKTSVARILAHSINHLPYTKDSAHLDIIEIDAASNNGVDDIRALREKARIAPVLASKKVYIIDEVHMLSRAAFNALLKTLEEPPEHVVFILATTDPDKLPTTILSRVQQFYLRPIPNDILCSQLISIAQQENFTLEPDAAEMIAVRSRGGFRDAISLLDQLSTMASSSQPLTAELVASGLGMADELVLRSLINAKDHKDSGAARDILSQLEVEGIDPIILCSQLMIMLRADLATVPTAVHLLGELIEVTKHPHPNLKLYTIFMDGTSSSPAHAVKSQSPQKTKVVLQRTKPSPRLIEPIAVKPEEAPLSTTKSVAEPFNGELDWDAVLSQAKTHSTALFTLLNRCKYEIADDGLRIYAGTSFAGKKLDDPKYRALLINIFSGVCNQEIDVRVIGSKKPPEDENLAAITAMMGGGEEISLENIS